MTQEEVKRLCGQIDWLRQTLRELESSKDEYLDAEERYWWERCVACCEEALRIKESDLANSVIMQPVCDQIQ